MARVYQTFLFFWSLNLIFPLMCILSFPLMDLDTDERRSMFADGSLQVRNVMAEDSGRYTCRAKNTVGEDTLSYTIRVKSMYQVSLFVSHL